METAAFGLPFLFAPQRCPIGDANENGRTLGVRPAGCSKNGRGYSAVEATRSSVTAQPSSDVAATCTTSGVVGSMPSSIANWVE